MRGLGQRFKGGYFVIIIVKFDLATRSFAGKLIGKAFISAVCKGVAEGAVPPLRYGCGVSYFSDFNQGDGGFHSNRFVVDKILLNRFLCAVT